MSLAIRQALPGDAHALCRAERETSTTPGLLVSLPHEFSEDAFKEKISWLSTAGIYLVAELDGRPCGHACLEPMQLQSRSHVFSLTMVVHPGYVGKGVGAALMSALSSWAEQQAQLEKIELLVRESNVVARKLYQQFGFIEEGRFERRLKLADGKYLADIAMARFFPSLIPATALKPFL